MKAADYQNQSGFSLVELMVVVGIIGTLAGIVVSSSKMYILKARQTEARQNVKTMLASVEGYSSENGIIGPDSSCDMFDPIVGCVLSYISPGCEIKNVFGVHLTDCDKSQYIYTYTAYPKPPAIPTMYAILAFSKKTLMNCGVWSSDVWYATSCGRTGQWRAMNTDCSYEQIEPNVPDWLTIGC